jgi:putative ABC transport system permease protein
MTRLRELGKRLIGLFGKSLRDADLNDEMAAHLDLLAAENIRRGMTQKEAGYAARREFGGVEQIKEAYRDRKGLPMLETFLQDLRFGARMLRKNPGFTVIAVLTLALGIGATTAIFSVVNTLLLSPLPFADSNRIVLIQESIPKLDSGDMGVSAPDVADFRRLNHVFEDVGAYSTAPADMSGRGEPSRVIVTLADTSVLRILRVSPVIGRLFTEEEEAPGHDVVLLEYGFWQSKYGGDPNVLGQKVLLLRKPYTVIGVMPPNFQFPSEGMPNFRATQLWTPLAFSPSEIATRGDNFDYAVVARLKPGVSVRAANSDVLAIAHQIEEQFYPANFRSTSNLAASAKLLKDFVVGPAKTLLWLLFGAVGLLLLIACANVANLLLARGAERHKEIAVRIAMGAGRARLVRQLLVESGLLGIIGGAIGIAAAYAFLNGLLLLAAQTLPRASEVSMDARVLLFAFGVSVLCSLIFGTAPALAATKTHLSETLKEGGRNSSSTRAHHRLRGAFVILQMAMALVLVTGSGLLIRSFVRARETDPGFRSENVVAASMTLARAQYSRASDVQRFYDALAAGTRALPGVISVGFASDLPLNSTWTHLFLPEGHETLTGAAGRPNAHTLVDENYFTVLGIPLIRGRFFDEDEARGKSHVVIISEGMAQRYWPGEDPVGRRLKWGGAGSDNIWLTIVGVVGNVKQGPLDSETSPHTYEPFEQICQGASRCGGRDLLLRSVISPTKLITAVRGIAQHLDSDQPVGNVILLTDLVSKSLGPRRFNTFLLGVFAAGALILAAIGIYGVLAYNVARETQDLGVRMALGAQTSDILRLVLGNGLRLALIGLGIGLAFSLALTRLMKSLLYDISATDPLTFAGVSLIFLTVAIAACWIPAMRATRVDPAVTLRCE